MATSLQPTGPAASSVPAASAAGAVPENGPTLTFRARLLALNSVITYCIATGTQLIVTPIALRILGVELFGAWSVIRQVLNYLNLADLRPFTGLKLTLGLTQHESEAHAKQRLIGAALVIWLVALPVMLGVAALVLFHAEELVPVSAAHRPTVALALSISLFGSIVATLLALPNNILRGMNLDYKAVGMQSALQIAFGVATVIALYAGFGLPGLAVAALLTPLGSSVVQWVLVRRHVPWFGVAKPRKSDLKDSARVNGWLLADTAMFVLVFGQDLVLAGIFLSIQDAAVLAVAGMAIRVAVELVGQVLLAASPGAAGLWGRQDFERVCRLRSEIHLLALGAMAVAGLGILMLNHAFLHLWVGSDMQVNRGVALGLLVLGFAQLGYRVEKMWMDFDREFQGRVIANAITAIVTMVLLQHTVKVWGIDGFIWSLAGPRLGLLAWAIWRNARVLRARASGALPPLWRAVVGLLAFWAAALLLPNLEISRWWSFSAWAFAIGTGGALLWFFGAMSQHERVQLSLRFSNR